MTGVEALQALKDGHRITHKEWLNNLWFSTKQPDKKTTSGCAIHVSSGGTLYVSAAMDKVLKQCDSHSAVASIVMNLVTGDDWEIVE